MLVLEMLYPTFSVSARERNQPSQRKPTEPDILMSSARLLISQSVREL